MLKQQIKDGDITYNQTCLMDGFIENKHQYNRNLAVKKYSKTYYDWCAPVSIPLRGKYQCVCSKEVTRLYCIKHKYLDVRMWVGATCATYFGINKTVLTRKGNMERNLLLNKNSRFCITCEKKIDKRYDSDITRTKCLSCSPVPKKKVRLCTYCGCGKLSKDLEIHMKCVILRDREQI
jgi:hypothetical protein